MIVVLMAVEAASVETAAAAAAAAVAVIVDPVQGIQGLEAEQHVAKPVEWIEEEFQLGDCCGHDPARLRRASTGRSQI